VVAAGEIAQSTALGSTPRPRLRSREAPELGIRELGKVGLHNSWSARYGLHARSLRIQLQGGTVETCQAACDRRRFARAIKREKS